MSEFEYGKRCSRGKPTLPRGSFGRNRSMRDGLQAYCRKCSADYYRERHEAQGRTVRVKVPVPRGPKRCPQCREVKLHAQGERNEAASDGWVSYCLSASAEHVDHDHKTGRVRGVLCFGCNAASGQFKDRPEVIQRAISYLEGNAWKPKLVAPGVYRLPS